MYDDSKDDTSFACLQHMNGRAILVRISFRTEPSLATKQIAVNPKTDNGSSRHFHVGVDILIFCRRFGYLI